MDEGLKKQAQVVLASTVTLLLNKDDVHNVIIAYSTHVVMWTNQKRQQKCFLVKNLSTVALQPTLLSDTIFCYIFWTLEVAKKTDERKTAAKS